MIKNLLKIIIFTQIMLTAAEEVVYAQLGESVSLKVTEDVMDKYTYWYFGEDNGLQLAWLNRFGGRGITSAEQWNRKLRVSSHALTLTNIQEEFFGVFICKVTFDGVNLSSVTKYRLIQLSVSVSPSSLLLPGESLSLNCNVGTHQEKNIHWMNPQKERALNNHGTFSKAATSKDNGWWACVVNNKARAQISLTVFDFSPDPPHQYTSTNSRLSLPCSIPSNITWEQIKEKGAQKIQWYFSPKSSLSVTSVELQRLFVLYLTDPLTWEIQQDRGLRPAPDLKGGNMSLTRDQGVEGDRGDYICSVLFKSGVTLNRTVHVDVLQFVSSVGTHIRCGQEVNLCCNTAESLPSGAVLRWFPPETSELKRFDHNRSHLTIKAATSGDGGQWRCELFQGNVWLTTEVITLKIEEEPVAWMLIIICSSAGIFILLLAITLTLCHHRRRKRKMKPVRHRLCHCKNPKPKRISKEEGF